MRCPSLALALLLGAACSHPSEIAGSTTTTSAETSARARAAERISAARCETATACADRPAYASRTSCTQALAEPSAAEVHLDQCGAVDDDKLRRCLSAVRQNPCAQLSTIDACDVCADEAEEGLP